MLLFCGKTQFPKSTTRFQLLLMPLNWMSVLINECFHHSFEGPHPSSFLGLFWCNVACSLSFLKTERLLNYPFIFLQILCSVSQGLSGLSFLPCLLTFHSISPVLRDILVHHAVLQNKLPASVCLLCVWNLRHYSDRYAF